MTTPISPRLLKGALVGLDPMNPLASVVVFQYNPDTMTRKLDARAAGTEGGDRSEAFRLSGPPKETITLAIEVDAADELEQGNPLTALAGISPTLAALEMLLYPKSTKVFADIVLAQLGNIEIVPPEAPLTLFVWGPQRVLPVRLSSLSVTEEAFDVRLSPIRAKIDLSLYVLSYADLKVATPGHDLFLVYQVIRETMATTNLFNSIRDTGAALKVF